MSLLIRPDGTYLSLIAQLDKLARHNRQGSFRTKERYYEAMKRFCRFLADEYRLQKLANISGKHLTAYVIRMQERGKSASTIKTDLAGIRFFHDKIDCPKYKLPGNEALALERRSFGGVDRAWSQEEFNRLINRVRAARCFDYLLAFYLARYAGLRIHECFRMDTAIAEQALREGAITIKGKGGKVRTVPVNGQITDALQAQLARVKRGDKLLVPEGMPTHLAISGLQHFIIVNRPELRIKSAAHLTFHGLRHTYAAETYREFTASGMRPQEACAAVSRLLGHERADVTRIYLASAGRGAEDKQAPFAGASGAAAHGT